MIAKLIEWVKAWDFMAILYSLLGSLIGILLLWWGGVFRRAAKAYRHRLAVRKYRSTLAEDCGLLPVVGRRKGFQLKEVYVPLDIATSDLMSQVKGDDDDPVSTASTYVLVGGPGAGKSTTVKQMLLKQLSHRRSIPIFVRLRDYVGFSGIEQYIVHSLQGAGFADPETLMQELLRSSRTLCVLDGLDEVRPTLRDMVISHVNSFYHKYFTQSNRLVVTCRKEAYRRVPLDIPVILEVRPLTDEQIQRFAGKWPLGFPAAKNADTFWRDLTATPRILELARSPLLLVGGLMQYTESNLGIPEERFEYLGRVARWLTVEWATAQGHPPDQYRQVYDRLLSRLAFHLHMEHRSDIERTEAARLFGEWLPTFGRDDVAAEEVIEAIGTRTGILVSDDRHFLVFAQFGLQEYFASLEVVTQVGANDLAALEPKEWWREVILLAVAQQREPTPILTALFDTAPLMAAAAVAECPTPSTEIQNKAIDACLAGIDAGNKEAGAAAVPLLRKIQAETEARMCAQLEERLDKGEPTASVVGIALATAGTATATNILAKHPEVWDQCLKDAGYLSASFENLLVDWIEKGTAKQSKKASELIASRLSADRLRQLLNLLPSLDPERAESLAALILDHSGRVFHAPDPFLMDVPLSVATRCSGFIRDRDRYLSARIERAMSRMRATQDTRTSMHRYYYHDMVETSGLVATCLYMEDRKGNRFSEDAMNKALHFTLLWSRRRGQLCLWALSAIAVGLLSAPFPWHIVGLLLCVLGATICAAFPHSVVPWSRRWFGVPTEGTVFINLALVAAGALGGFTSTVRNVDWLSAVLTLSAASCIAIAGFLLLGSWFSHRFNRLLNREPSIELTSPPSLRFFSLLYPILYVVFLVGVTIVIAKTGHVAGAPQRGVLVVAAGILAWVIVGAIRLKTSSRCVTRAAERSKTVMSKIIEEKS